MVLCGIDVVTDIEFMHSIYDKIDSPLKVKLKRPIVKLIFDEIQLITKTSCGSMTSLPHHKSINRASWMGCTGWHK